MEAGHQAASVSYRDVTKRYPGQKVPAINHLSLEVPAGEICVLVGPSGCGKTTALRMVNRTVEITEGDILIGDTSVRDRDPDRAAPRDRLRDPADRPVPPPDDRREHRHRPEAPRLGQGAHRARVRELIERDRARSRSSATGIPSQLSGGQQQRVGSPARSRPTRR